MALAIVECQNENTQMIKHLLQTFNKCLQHTQGLTTINLTHME